MNKPRRILVCGGRDYIDKATVDYTLNEARKHWFAEDFCIIEGGATGADRLARSWANHNAICVITICANWDVHGNRAGSIRNGWMLQYGKPDCVLVFPGGKGTRDMHSQARHIPGLFVYEVEP